MNSRALAHDSDRYAAPASMAIRTLDDSSVQAFDGTEPKKTRASASDPFVRLVPRTLATRPTIALG